VLGLVSDASGPVFIGCKRDIKQIEVSGVLSTAAERNMQRVANPF